MPRILTNNADLPLPIFMAIKNDTYEPRGDISVTTLIDSPYIRLLRKYNQYEEDAGDMVWALQGQALHSVIERAGDRIGNSRFFPELKMEMKVSGKVISGTTDLLERQYDDNGLNTANIIHDYKNIFVWAAKAGLDGPAGHHWKYQLNMYALMCKYGLNSTTREKIGIKIDKIYIHAFIRDWKKSESKRMIGYPSKGVITFEIELMNESYISGYVKDRVASHFLSEDAMSKGFDVPYCTDEERWTRPEIWKMMKGENKKSSKNFTINTEQDKKDAELWYALNLGQYDGKLNIVKEPGTDTRCTDYCSVCQFCKYYKENYNEYGERKKGNITTGDAPVVSTRIEEPELPEIKFDLD